MISTLKMVFISRAHGQCTWLVHFCVSKKGPPSFRCYNRKTVLHFQVVTYKHFSVIKDADLSSQISKMLDYKTNISYITSGTKNAKEFTVYSFEIDHKICSYMCKLSHCLVSGQRGWFCKYLSTLPCLLMPFDVSCKPELTHCKAPTPPWLPSLNKHQNFALIGESLRSPATLSQYADADDDLTEQQQLELPPGISLVFPQLALDLGVDPLLLLLLLREAARHHCGCHPRRQGSAITSLS